MYKRLKQMPIKSMMMVLKPTYATTTLYLRKALTLRKKHFINPVLKNIEITKKTWLTIKEIIDKSSQRKQLPEYFNIDGLTVTDKHVIANKFNDFFTSIGLKLANKLKI